MPAWLSAKNVAFRARCLDWGLWTGGCVPPRPRVSCDQFNPFITSIQSNARNQKNEALLAKFQHAPSWKHYSDPIRRDHVTFLKNSQFLPYSNVPETFRFSLSFLLSLLFNLINNPSYSLWLSFFLPWLFLEGKLEERLKRNSFIACLPSS